MHLSQNGTGLDKHLKWAYGCPRPYTYPSDWTTKSSLVSASFRLVHSPRVKKKLLKYESNLESRGENINGNIFQEYFHYSTGIWGPFEMIPGGSQKLKNGCRFETQISHPTLSSPQDPRLLVARFLPPSDFPLCNLAEIIAQMWSPSFIRSPINYINHMLLIFYSLKSPL